MTFAKPFCVKPDVCPPAPVNQPNNCNPANREGALPDSLDQFSNMFSTMDPWGHPYKLVKEDTRFYVVSFGPDGREGTADDVRSDRQ